MAQRITGVCVLPGATWEPPRAARQLSGSPVSTSMSLLYQTDLFVPEKVILLQTGATFFCKGHHSFMSVYA